MTSVNVFQLVETFRQEVRRFCEESLPEDLRRKVRRNEHLEKSDYALYIGLLTKRGWSVGHWPVEYGGKAWSPLERFVFEEEATKCGAPRVFPFGINMVGPVIIRFGSTAQRDRFLPGIRSGTSWWCQGYSEPNAGSDLASLRTRAIRRGDRYIVNGQKIWTSYAHWADWMFALVRTDPEARPQSGISFLLIDMKSPGVTVRPIVSMDMCHHLNEVFFDDVEVPIENLVGREGEGWTCAKFLLGHERTLSAETGPSTRQLGLLKTIASTTTRAGRTLREDPIFRRRIAELDLRLHVLRATCHDVLARSMEGGPPGVEASLLKLRGSELQQDIAEALVDVLGLHGIVYDPRSLRAGGSVPPEGPSEAPGILRDHLFNRASSIFAGSNEIQRNILAKAVLEL